MVSNLREIKYWLSDTDLKSIYTSAYWNDIEKEKKKEWWIDNGNYEKCLHYINSSGLLSEYQKSEKFIQEFSRKVVIADLASGIGWTSALLSKLSNVAEVHAVEISKHRLGSLFENAVKNPPSPQPTSNTLLSEFIFIQFDLSSGI